MTSKQIKWTNTKALEVLANNVARAMMSGKQSPVAEKVLARLERSAKIEQLIASEIG